MLKKAIENGSDENRNVRVTYRRLIEREKQKEIDPTEDGDPAYYKKMTADKMDMRGIIREAAPLDLSQERVLSKALGT
jgi:hypothetical protein